MQQTLLTEQIGTTRRGKRRHAWLLVAARTACLVLSGTAIVLFFFSLPTYYSNLLIVCTTVSSCASAGQLSQSTLSWLQSFHLAVSAYAVLYLALAALDALLSLIVGIVIVWRLWGTASEWLGLLTTFVLILLGTIDNSSGNFATFSPILPLFLQVVGFFGFFLFWPALGMFLLTFPTGRFAPRWTWSMILLWIIQFPLYPLLANGSPLLFTAERFLVWGSSFVVFLWRYWHLYTYAQRQQSKWLLYGLVPFYILQWLLGVLQGIPALNTPVWLYQVIGPILLLIAHFLLPVGVGIALLRYRLWDIDVLINRTVVYGLLTATLLAIYLLLVFAGQFLLAHILGPNNAVVLVVSTLVVAALFQPLRRRLQQMVDRRFYRKKYDAVRTLEAFSATLRSEVDLSQLRQHLLGIVQETMQPTHVSLWLRQPIREASPSLETSKASLEEARRLE